jgi:hypothetical protein
VAGRVHPLRESVCEIGLPRRQRPILPERSEVYDVNIVWHLIADTAHGAARVTSGPNGNGSPHLSEKVGKKRKARRIVPL